MRSAQEGEEYRGGQGEREKGNAGKRPDRRQQSRSRAALSNGRKLAGGRGAERAASAGADGEAVVSTTDRAVCHHRHRPPAPLEKRPRKGGWALESTPLATRVMGQLVQKQWQGGKREGDISQ